MSSSCNPNDHSQVISVEVFSPFPRDWLALQQCINTAVVGFGQWNTAVCATLTAGLTGYVMFSQNINMPGAPTSCYLVDIYANRSAKDATELVKAVQDAICMFLNSPPPSIQVVFTVRYAEPESLAPSERRNVNIDGGCAASSNSSRIAHLEREVKALQKNLASKL